VSRTELRVRLGVWAGCPRRHWLLLGVLITGLATRGLLLTGDQGGLSSDDAVTYLMARQAADGQVRAFYWGQYYANSLLAALTGALFWVTGSREIGLQLVEIALQLVAVLLLRELGQRLISPLAGDLAAGLFWLAPTSCWLSLHDPGHVGTGLSLALGAVLAGLLYLRSGST
jgi:hypothetical protein